MYIGLYVKYPLFLSDFNVSWIFWTYFRKKKRNIFRENPSSGRKVFRRKRTGRRIDMSKLVITFEIWRNHLTMAWNKKKTHFNFVAIGSGCC